MSKNIPLFLLGVVLVPLGNIAGQQTSPSLLSETLGTVNQITQASALPSGPSVLEPSIHTLRQLILTSPIGGFLTSFNASLFDPEFEQFLNSPAESTEAAKAYTNTLGIITRSLGELPSLPKSYYTPNLEVLEQILASVNKENETALLYQLSLASAYKGDANFCTALRDAVASISAARATYLQLQIRDELIGEQARFQFISGHIPIAEGLQFKLNQDGAQQQLLNTNANLQWHALALLLYAQQRYQLVPILCQFCDYWNNVNKRDQKLEYPFFPDRRPRYYGRIDLNKDSFEPDLLSKLPVRDGKILTTFLSIGKSISLGKLATTLSEIMRVAGRSPPSLSKLQELSEKTMSDVEAGIPRYHSLLAQNKIGDATTLLLSLWSKSPYQPSIQTLPLEEKRKSVRFIDLVHNTADELGSGSLDTLANTITALGTLEANFNSSEILQYIQKIKDASNLHTAQAKDAVAQNDFVTAKAEIARASALWPNNPAIASFSTDVTKIGDDAMLYMQVRTEFDHLYNQGDFRRIFNEKEKYMAAVAADISDKKAEHQENLRIVLTQMQEIETAIMKSQEIASRGDNAGAWEALEEISVKYPNDQKLTQMRADLSSKAANFINDFQQAKAKESQKQFDSALAWYLQILHHYPMSDLAKQGVNRMVKQALPDAS